MLFRSDEESTTLGSDSNGNESDDCDISDKTELTSNTSGGKTRTASTKNRLLRVCCCIFSVVLVVNVAIGCVFGFQFFYNAEGAVDVEATMFPQPASSDLEVTSVPDTPSPSTSPPSPSPTKRTTNIPTEKPTEDYIGPIKEFLQDHQVTFDNNFKSANSMALLWLADEARALEGSTVPVSSEYGNGLPEFNHKLIQRFVLLALGYALSGSASETIGVQLVDECKWEGVVCSTTNGESFDKVEEIRLSYSDLTGKIQIGRAHV